MENKTKIGDIIWWHTTENKEWSSTCYGFVCKVYPSYFDGLRIIQAIYCVKTFQDLKVHTFQGCLFNQTWGLSS